MNTTTQYATAFVRYLLVAVLLLSFAGLSAWYFFLRSKTTTIAATDMARGFGSSAPTFEGGGGSTYQNITSDTSVTGVSPVESASRHGGPPQLWKISPNPVAGMGFVQSGTSTMVYFVERATGYVFFADTKTSKLTRVTNTLRPKIYEALFTKNGSVVERSLDDAGNITTFTGTLPAASLKYTATTTEPLYGKSLEKNIISIAANPLTPEIFYTVIDAKTGLVGIRAQWDGSKTKQVFSSNMFDWRLRWLQDGRFVVTQNAADNTPGYSYELSQTGAQTLLIGDVPGLTLLPRASSAAILYGSSSGGILSLWAKVDKKTSAVRLPLKTVADKCVWAPPPAKTPKVADKTLIAYCAVPRTLPSGDFLDQWYRGSVHTEDVWWYVNVSDGNVRSLFPTANIPLLDVDRPTIDESGNYIAFINAADKSLWLLRLDTERSATSTKM